jgi:hypothetical protein
VRKQANRQQVRAPQQVLQQAQVPRAEQQVLDPVLQSLIDILDRCLDKSILAANSLLRVIAHRKETSVISTHKMDSKEVKHYHKELVKFREKKKKQTPTLLEATEAVRSCTWVLNNLACDVVPATAVKTYTDAGKSMQDQVCVAARRFLLMLAARERAQRDCQLSQLPSRHRNPRG